MVCRILWGCFSWCPWSILSISSSISLAPSICNCQVSSGHVSKAWDTNCSSKVNNRFASYVCLFVIILDFHIDNMYGLVVLATARQKIWKQTSGLVRACPMICRTIANSVKTALFTSDHYVCNCFAFLPPFGGKFDLSVAIEHLQETVGSIPETRVWMIKTAMA